MYELLKKSLLLAVIFTVQFKCYSQHHESLNEKYVIVLDVQVDSTRNLPETEVKTDFINAINTIIKNSNPNKIIYVKAIHRVLSFSFTGHSIDTLPILDLDHRLEIVSNHIFEKNKPDAFSNKELVEFLSMNHAEEIIVVGLMAEECLFKTALGGLKQDLDIFIVPEAIIGKTEKGKEKAIKRLWKKGVKVLPLAKLTEINYN